MFAGLLAFLLVLTCFSVVIFRFAQFNLALDEHGSPHPWAVQLLIGAICASHLFVVSQSLLAAFTVLRFTDHQQAVASSGYLNAVIGAALLLTVGRSVIWFLTALGLWRRKFWAYYLAVLLNVITLLVLMPPTFASSSDVADTARILLTLVLLLVPPVRNQFRRTNVATEQSAASPD